MNHIDVLEKRGPSSEEDYEVAGRRRKIWLGTAAAIAILIGVGEFGSRLFQPAAPPPPPPPSVGVSQPLQRDVDQRLSFLGQFAAIKSVEIRAQVGGTLTAVNFKDGDVVRQGQLLFQIDPVPYQIKFDQANAELESANARLALAVRELVRAQQLKATDAGSVQNVDQKVAEKAAAQAAVDGAKATLHDARFDLDRTKIYAPFTGRIGTHLVSAGNLIAGSRAASSPTTLLTTLVSLDPIWLNFDMSEQDYMTFQRERARVKGPLANKVDVALSGDDKSTRQGTLDFLDNAIDRASGTIHARATLQNADTSLTPGAFGRVQLAVSAPTPTLLVPDAAVLTDQGDHSVYVVGKDNVVSQKKITIGALRGGLRVVTSGLSLSDKIVVDGIPSVKSGAPITPQAGAIRFDPGQD
jgi:RND family efflux transporter MFP subunit